MMILICEINKNDRRGISNHDSWMKDGNAWTNRESVFKYGDRLSRSVPNAKSTLVAHTWAPSPSPHRPPSGLLQLVQPHGPVPITPDWTHWTRSPNPQQTAHRINPPHPQGDGSLPRSRGHHVMIAQPHVTRTTSSVDPLAGGPRCQERVFQSD